MTARGRSGEGVGEVLAAVAADDALLEVGRKAIEDELVKWRDSRLFTIRGNGFVVRESDGGESSIIRFGPEVGLRIALAAMSAALAQPSAERGEPNV